MEIEIGYDPELKKITKRILFFRDLVAIRVWTLWGNFKSREEMDKLVNYAHELHRDYLRIAYSVPIRKISPMPHKVIDDNAPERYIRRADEIRALVMKKDEVEKAVVDAGTDREKLGPAMTDLDSANKQLAAARDDFLEFSHYNLSAVYAGDVVETTYRYIDDGLGEPIKGGPVPNIALTISQMNRLGRKVK